MTAPAASGLAVASAVRLVPYDRDRHGDAPWRVVEAVFAEYGFAFAMDDYDADLLDPAAHYDARGGWFTVAEDADGRVVGCVGGSDEGDGVYELHRLYVLAEARRSGAGSALLRSVIDTARARGGRKVILFSDVHFEDAHRLYLRFGFRCTRFRYAPDPWQSREWGFELSIHDSPTALPRSPARPLAPSGGAGEER
jgi:putative acetyltransferase